MNRDASWKPDVEHWVDMLSSRLVDEAKGSFMRTIAESAGVSESDIISHDLFPAVRDNGRYGERRVHLSATLGNLQCAYGCLEGFIAAKNSTQRQVLAVFDNEETGFSHQAGRRFHLEWGARNIPALRAGWEEVHYRAVSWASWWVQITCMQGYINLPRRSIGQRLTRGIIIKFNAAQRYTTDAVSCAVYREPLRVEWYAVQVFYK